MCPLPLCRVSCCILERPAKFPWLQKHRQEECPLPSFLPGSFHFVSPASLYPGLSADNLPLLVNFLFILLKCVQNVQRHLGRSHHSVLYARAGTLRRSRDRRGQVLNGDYLPQAMAFSFLRTLTGHSPVPILQMWKLRLRDFEGPKDLNLDLPNS